MEFQDVQQKYRNQFPVPLISMANDMGISVYQTDKLPNSVSGLIAKEDDGFFIYVNNNHPITRKRFTIAHELAHFIKHKSILEEEGQHIDGAKTVILMRSDDHNKIEKEANELAAEILMPEEEFEKEWKKAETIEEVAEVFGVSVQAASIRGSVLLGEVFI